MFPTVNEGLNKLGIFTDGVATHTLSGAMRPDRPMDPTAEKIAQQGVESIYQRFLGLVSEARKREVVEIDAIAQGRVWTGGKAQALGLVDQLGYLDDLVKAVAEKHQISTPKLKLIQRDLSAQEQLIRNLVDQSSHVQYGPLSQLFSRLNALLSNPAISQLNNFEQAAKPFGFSIMAACLECSAL
jgi:protease-4